MSNQEKASKAKLAADHLAASLCLPPSAVSVWTWHRGALVTLRLRIDPQYRYQAAHVPTNYEGFEVEVENRDSALGSWKNI